MCYFLLGFLDSRCEAVESCWTLRILERAVLNVAGFTWGTRTREQQGERDCERGETNYHLSQINPTSSYDRGLEEQVIESEPVVDTEITGMFGTERTKLGDHLTAPFSPSDEVCVKDGEPSAHLPNIESGHCGNYTRNNRAYGMDEVFVIDEEKDNTIHGGGAPPCTTFTRCDVVAQKALLTKKEEDREEEVAALCSNYVERVQEYEFSSEKSSEECKTQEQKWRSELEEEMKASWQVDPMNTFQRSSGSEAEPVPVYNTDVPVISLMDDLADFKTVLVTLATHLNEASNDSPSLEEQIKKALSEECLREESTDPTVKQPEQRQDYHKTLESISDDMLAIRTNLDSLQGVLKSTSNPDGSTGMEVCGP